MCTLTYLPKGHSGYFLTSNRDENVNRKSAISPTIYNHGSVSLLYPKDVKAGGTWLVAADNGYTLCLLNGAFVKHFPEPPYKKSRGLVVLNFFDFNDPNLFAQLYDFNGIEPFTLIIISQQRTITELRWDGSLLHKKMLDGAISHIWSSATLYDLDIRQMRELIFNEFIQKHELLNVPDLLKFHHFSSSNNSKPSIKMAQNSNGVQTISVTCIESNLDNFIMHHEDILSNITNRIKLIKGPNVNQS